MMNGFKIGDKVKIVDDGLLYSTYSDMAKHLNMNKFIFKKYPKKLENSFKIRGIAKHLNYNYNNILVFIENREGQFIVGIEALKHVVTCELQMWRKEFPHLKLYIKQLLKQNDK